MKPISGEPITNKYALPLSQAERQYKLDFIYSDKLEEIEAGIQETAKGVNMGILALSLAFAKIDSEALYVQADCKSYLEYLDTAEDRLNMSRQTMSDYKRIGETYLQYKSKLQKVGFKEDGNLHKLRFLERALEHHKSAEVFKRIGTDSIRSFIEYAKGPSERSDEVQYNPDIQITPKRIMVDGKNVLNFSNSLDDRTKEDLTDYLKRIYEVRATGNHPYILNVYDEKEAKAVEQYLRRYRLRH
ncbi:unnamed protein product [marine sediment metagenome]|uniref:Uncharacterized protein n=1 Tax=marine sediment metagenome TaxID=412755 RepID=X0RYC2_9ZZZZ